MKKYLCLLIISLFLSTNIYSQPITPSAAVDFTSPGAIGSTTPSTIKGTTIEATGIFHGKEPITLAVTSAGYTIGATYRRGYIFANPVADAGNFIFTLPVAAAGLYYCVGSYAAKTGTTTVNTNKPGGAGTQYIDLDGTLTANTGNVSATGAAGNLACFFGVSSTVWKSIPTKGTWSRGP